MRYLHKTLLDDEQVIYTTRPHWIVFLPSLTLLAIALSFWIGGPFLFVLNAHLRGFALYEVFAALFGIYGGYQFMKQYITHHWSEYGVTNKRVLMKTGWMERNSLEMFLDKIETVHVDQTIMGRILGFGSITIIGTGGSKDPFLNVPRPLHFRKMIQQEIDYAEGKLYHH